VRDTSISVYFAREVLRHAAHRGLDPAALLRRNRISPRLLQEANARIALSRLADLQASTMLALADESLGYGSRRLPPGCWAMMCHAVINCETLGHALSRYCRFYQLFESEPYPVLSVDGEIARIQLESREPPNRLAPFFAELQLFTAHRFASWLVQEHLPVRAIHFSFPQAAPGDAYHSIFLGNPVAFGQDDCALYLSPTLLDKPVTQTEQTLRHFLRHPVLILLTQRYDRDSWTNRVRTLIARDMLAVPELSEVAERLEVHPQTLRRRLSAEGTTFKQIKNQLRRDTALHFLGKRGLSIEEIAHRSGFSESSAFIRAFKGWTGVTPYSYRKGL
jgi:AraC-like DNA-binding protein